MKSPQKTIAKLTGAKATTASKSTLTKKLSKSLNINFPIDKNIDVNDLEIRITVRGNEIVAKVFVKGVAELEQLLLVKPKPTPPPVTDDVIKAINRLKLNLTYKKLIKK
ncbi:hypothetical protein [Pedobacter namyangjuensis]|uniref:hypothetical protein n=1 Tax=Pedobacter namyangjuensis TaxID=600626 RepID=UPI000DE40C29|nr:hypothetical protein [Pedobacter namyangjuensis]